MKPGLFLIPLLITTAVAGFAFIFMQRSFELSTNTVDTGMQSQLAQLKQRFMIESVNSASHKTYVRHIGSLPSDTARVIIYVNNTKVDCSWDSPGAWLPNEVKICEGPDIACSGNAEIEVSGPAGRDSLFC
jgi:hypothetical protein